MVPKFIPNCFKIRFKDSTFLVRRVNLMSLLRSGVVRFIGFVRKVEGDISVIEILENFLMVCAA